MTRVTGLLIVAAAAGCAATPEDLSVLERNDSISDYIEVSELKESDAIRSFGQLSHRVITEKYIIISDGSDTYLAVYARDCKEPFDREIRVDLRRERNILRARFDTFRGCRIRALYEIGAGQAQELMQLGEAPGK